MTKGGSTFKLASSGGQLGPLPGGYYKSMSFGHGY